MFIEAFQTAAGSKIAVTNTATNIFDLVNTSQSTALANAGFSNGVNAIIIQPEDGDVRVLFNGTPTSTNGFLIQQGAIATLCNVPLKAMKLIRTGGSNVNCSIQVGKSDLGESSAIIPSGGSGGLTANVNLNQVGGTAITLGQKTMAASIPVVLPSDAAANSGSASSGDATYMSPSDFTAVYASGTTLTLTGLPFAPTTGQFMSVKRQDTTGMSVTYTPDVKAFSYNSTTGVLTVTGAAFTATDVFVVTVIGPTKSLDTSTDAKRVSQIRDLSDQYVAEDLIDTTNVAAATNYYPSSSGVSMDGYRNLSIEALTSGGVTSTIEVTIDGASSPDWIDITSQVYDWVTGAYAASYVDVNFLMFLENLNVKAVRIKSVTSDATNAVQYNIRRLF